MSFESNMENYKDTMSSIMGGELAASAQRIAEGANLGEEARQATGQVIGPLALDMLREGIMAKSGIASALGKDAPTDFKGLVKAGLQDGLEHLKGKALEAAKARGIPTTTDEALTAGKNQLAAIVKGKTGIDVSDIAGAADPVTAAMSRARSAVGDVKSQVSDLANVATSANPVTAVTVAKGFAGRGGPQVAQGAPPVAPKGEGEEDEDEPAFIGAGGRDITPPLEEQASSQDLIGAARQVIENPTPDNTAALRSGAADIFKTLTKPDSEPSSEPSSVGTTVTRQFAETEDRTLSDTFGTALGGVGAVGAAAAAASQQGLTGTQRAVAAGKSLAVPLTEEVLGGLVPGAAIGTIGAEIFASKGGSLASKAEQFGEAGLVIKGQQYAAKGINNLVQRVRGGAEDAGEDAGEGGGDAGVSGGASVSGGAGISSGAGAGADFVPNAALTSGSLAGEGIVGDVGGTVVAAPVAEGAGTAAAGAAEGGLFGSAEAAAAAGPESGGAGFIVAGVLGIAGVLASIFAPHHTKAPEAGPAPNLAIPVQAIGIN